MAARTTGPPETSFLCALLRKRPRTMARCQSRFESAWPHLFARPPVNKTALANLVRLRRKMMPSCAVRGASSLDPSSRTYPDNRERSHGACVSPSPWGQQHRRHTGPVCPSALQFRSTCCRAMPQPAHVQLLGLLGKHLSPSERLKGSVPSFLGSQLCRKTSFQAKTAEAEMPVEVEPMPVAV